MRHTTSPIYKTRIKCVGWLGKIPIIGSGGIFSGADAFEKIANGASLIEVYTAMIVEGPLVVKKIKDELVEILK